MQSFYELKVWQKSHALTLEVYRVSQRFPKSEEFGLRSQMRRAAASIGANIAEGCGRSGRWEFVQFLNLALGSASELEYQVLLARDLGLLDDATHRNTSAKTVEVKRMLAVFSRRVRSRAAEVRPRTNRRLRRLD